MCRLDAVYSEELHNGKSFRIYGNYVVGKPRIFNERIRKEFLEENCYYETFMSSRATYHRPDFRVSAILNLEAYLP